MINNIYLESGSPMKRKSRKHEFTYNERLGETAKRLDMLHDNEDKWNREMSEIDKEIKRLLNRKKHLSVMVSNNVKYRKQLIEESIIK